MNKSFDYIIAGAGSVGCVLANRLSASGKHSVLLLEAGGKDWHPLIHLPLGFVHAMALPAINWGYETLAEPQLQGRKIDCPRGRVLGGSSAINGMIYIRGQREDFNAWQAQGCEGWSYNDVLPWFKKSEKHIAGANAYHGSEGEMSVSACNYQHDLTGLYIKSGIEAGIQTNTDFNGEQQQGIGYGEYTITENGKRASSAQAFLSSVKKRSNLTIITAAQVKKILLDDGIATGLIYHHKGKEKIVKADKEVVLSSGSIGSAQILQCSGIGDETVLKRAGVPVNHHLPGVGKNLQDHLTVDVVAAVKNTGTTNDDLKPLRFIRQLIRYMFTGQGFFSMAAAPALAFINSKNQASRADLQIHFAPAAGEKNAKGIIIPAKISAITSTACCLQPKSRGHVLITAADILTPPEIQFNYLDSPEDQQKMIAAVKWQRKIFQQSPLQDFIAKEVVPGKEIQGDSAILDYVRREAKSIYHPVGSCKMGTDSDAVVDSQLRVYGIQRLRVIDASIMPNIVSGNTNATTVMIAERGSDWILQTATAQQT